MAKIQVVCYVSHENYAFIHEIMQSEGIPTPSKAINYIISEYPLFLNRIRALQKAILEMNEGSPTAAAEKMQQDPQKTP